MFDYDGKYVNHIGLQYNSTRKICGKPYISEALCNHHSKEYHGSKPEPPAEADDNKHDQEAMIPYRKAVDITPEGELDKNRSVAPLHGTCDECEIDWVFESNLKLHKNVHHTKFTRVQSVMKIEIRSPNEKMKSSLRHLQPGLMDHFEPFFKNQKSQFKITEQIKRMEGFSDKINLSSDSTNEDET